MFHPVWCPLRRYFFLYLLDFYRLENYILGVSYFIP